MTRAEIIAIQTELGVQADGIWGPITAAAYAARMAHEAPHAPVVMPPVSKPWWQSRAVLGLLASVLAMIAGRFGWSIDDGQITDILLKAEELGELATAMARHDPEKISDALGDVLVTLIILAHLLDRDPVTCLEGAYEEIKHRKGRMQNGLFVKAEVAQ